MNDKVTSQQLSQTPASIKCLSQFNTRLSIIVGPLTCLMGKHFTFAIYKKIINLIFRYSSRPDVGPTDKDAGDEVLDQAEEVLVPQEEHPRDVDRQALRDVVRVIHDGVCQRHGYGQQEADDPDNDDDDLGGGLADVGPQWEHNGLISVTVKCTQLALTSLIRLNLSTAMAVRVKILALTLRF